MTNTLGVTAHTTKGSVEIKVGDIYERSWGYNCTRTTFVKIIGFNKSGKKAFVRELGTSQVDGDWMNGNITANEEHMGEDVNELTIKVRESVEPISDRYAVTLRGRLNHTVKDKETGEVKWVNKGMIETFYKWDGKPIWNNCD